MAGTSPSAQEGSPASTASPRRAKTAGGGAAVAPDRFSQAGLEASTSQAARVSPIDEASLGHWPGRDDARHAERTGLRVGEDVPG